jgi:hypothetical protein
MTDAIRKWRGEVAATIENFRRSNVAEPRHLMAASTLTPCGQGATLARKRDKRNLRSGSDLGYQDFLRERQ